MKRKRLLLTITTAAALIGVSIGLASNHNVNITRVEADPHLENYDPYTYSGSYYDSIDFDAEGGLNGTLRQSITNLSIPKGFYVYGSNGETHLSTQLQYADEDPANSNNMIFFYTRNSVPKTNATVDGTMMWNREHVWCQSKSNGNWGTYEAGTDILHLRPTYESTNKSRGDTLYGNSGHATPKTYSGMNFGWTGNGYFEPLDSAKGDVARIIMYLWTTYNGYKDYKPLNIEDIFESYDTLLSWHTSDKPDVFEGHRNDYSQTSKQKNRNPFVDHPELAWKIFGDSVSSSVKDACMEAYPIEEPDDATRVQLSIADYATTNSIASTTKVSSIAIDPVVTATANGTDGNTGKIYINAAGTIHEWRFYNSGTGTLNISVANGYELLSAKAQVTTSNYGATNEVALNVSDNTASYCPGTNFNVRSISITYRAEGAPKYTVTFNSNGGSIVNSQRVSENNTASVPIDPVKESTEYYNYAFDSWYLDAGLTNEYDFDTPVTGNITLYAKWIQTDRTAGDVIENAFTQSSLAYRYTNEVSTITDTFNNASFDARNSTYKSWSNKTDASNAVYAGNAAGDNNSVQLRKSDSSQAKSGIVSTATGGTIKKVTVSWNSNTTAGRVLNVYGKNTAYTSADDLYNASTYGTLLGTIEYGIDTELTIDDNYAYIGIVSKNGAMYLNSIAFEWSFNSSIEYPRAGLRFTGQISVNLWNRLNGESTILGYGILLSDADFLKDDELKDYYELADDDVVKDFYRPLTEKAHPDTTNGGEDYIWSLFRQVSRSDFNKVYVSVAYIKTQSGIVFLNQTEASIKTLAAKMLSGNDYNDGSYEGSLYHLAHEE